jgi:2-(1,2-epoxy-1,2-dihydrophenyl)acetyl-CoA isomerase
MGRHTQGSNMSYETILWDIRDGVATLTFHRPDRLNAFTQEMHREIREVMDRVEEPGAARVLVITGSGRASDFDAASTLEVNYNPWLKRLRALPMPVIAAVNGVAAGAAANVALGCDLVVAARSATFLQAFARIALIPDAGGTYVLPRLVGMARAMGLVMGAEPLPAEQAAQWGLIWKCVDDDKFADEVARLARGFASGPTGAYALIKQAMYASQDNDHATQLALEAALQKRAGASRDFAEGVAAFLEKRRPEFQGR